MAKSRFRKTANYSESLKKRTEQSSGGGFVTIFKDNLPLYKEPKEGDVGINIIPYIATSNHPQAAEGSPVYKIELWVHQRIGPEKGDYVCLRNFDQDCPLCEARYEELGAENPRKKISDRLKGSHRAIYNVQVVSSEQEESKGVQIWTSSTYLGENNFLSVAKNRKTGEKIPFSCPDTGKTIWFTVKGSFLTKEFAGITMEDRPEPISDNLLDEAYELENCIIIPKAEDLAKIAKIVLGGGDDDSDENERPSSPPRRSRGDVETGSKRGRRPPVDDDDEDEAEDEAPPRRGRDTEDNEDEAPPRRSRNTEEDEDEAPPPRRSRKTEEDEDKEPPPRRERSRSRKTEDEEDEAPPPRRGRLKR